MSLSLRNRSVAKLLDFEPGEIRFLLDLAKRLDAGWRAESVRTGFARKEAA